MRGGPRPARAPIARAHPRGPRSPDRAVPEPFEALLRCGDPRRDAIELGTDVGEVRLIPAQAGTCSFGKAFIGPALTHLSPRRLVVFSRDELKHSTRSVSTLPLIHLCVIRDERRLDLTLPRGGRRRSRRRARASRQPPSGLASESCSRRCNGRARRRSARPARAHLCRGKDRGCRSGADRVRYD